MNETIIIVAAIFMAMTVLWLVYWALVRPVILDGVDQELATMRERVDWAIIEDEPGAQSRAAQRLLSGLHRGKRFLSLSNIIYFAMRFPAHIKAEIARDREIFADAPKWVIELRNRNAELAVKAALINSPFWWGPIAVLLLLAVLSQKMAARLRDTGEAAVILREDELCPA